jgi:hypothetical protein
VGRGREVILEGEEQPGEERPSVGVNNAGDGERTRNATADILGAAAPQGGKPQGGRLDPRGTSGGVGEKPLKGGTQGRTGLKHDRQDRDTRRAGRGKPGRSMSHRKGRQAIARSRTGMRQGSHWQRKVCLERTARNARGVDDDGQIPNATTRA